MLYKSVFIDTNPFFEKKEILDVQLCFRRFPIDGFSGK